MASTAPRREPFWDPGKQAAYDACQPATLRGAERDKHENAWHSVRRDPAPATSDIAWRPRLALPEAQVMKPTKKRQYNKKRPTKKRKFNENDASPPADGGGAHPVAQQPPLIQDERYAVRARSFRLRLDKDQRRTLCNRMGAARFT